MAKYVIEVDERLVARVREDIATGLRPTTSGVAIANAIPLADYLAAQQPKPPPNVVNVPLTVWIAPTGVTVAGFAPLPGCDGDSFPVAEIMIESGFVDSEMIQENITASIAIPLPEPVTVVGTCEVTP